MSYDIRVGDIWKLGRHRLAVGSCTDADLMARLCDGRKVDLVFTSPPYLDKRDYDSGGKIKRGFWMNRGRWAKLMSEAFAVIFHYLLPDAQVFVNLGLVLNEKSIIPYWDDLVAAANKAHLRWHSMYVWDQGLGLPGEFKGRMVPSFELIFGFNYKLRVLNKTVPVLSGGDVYLERPKSMRRKDGNFNPWSHRGREANFLRVRDSVVRITREKDNTSIEREHPARFPVGLPTEFMATFTQRDQIVLDPFLGSGTTMIAAEKAARTCFGVEIEPKYADLVLRRFALLGPSLMDDRKIALLSRGKA